MTDVRMDPQAFETGTTGILRERMSGYDSDVDEVDDLFSPRSPTYDPPTPHFDSDTVSELSDMAMDSDDDPAQIVPPSQKVTTDLNEIANNIISNDYTPPSGSTIQTDPIAEALASTINRWLRTCLSKNNTKTYFQKCLVLSNVEGLNPVRINEMVYPRLSFKAKE